MNLGKIPVGDCNHWKFWLAINSISRDLFRLSILFARPRFLSPRRMFSVRRPQKVAQQIATNIVAAERLEF